MLRVLLVKDLRRAWRNPVPWLINLALPLCVTALVGLAFSGGGEGSSLGRIKFAVVDEDDSALTAFLRGGANQGKGGKYLEPVFLDRATALRQINDNQLSAVLIIPEHFTRNYLTGRQKVSLELIKNPAQSIHPAVLEELLGALVTALNALSRNFQSEFPDWQAVFAGRGDYHEVARLIERGGNKLETVRKYVYPPLVSYEKEVRAGESKAGPAFNLFAFLLAGMAGMFLLFLANNGMSDLHRELRQRTFERYQTLRERLLPFVVGKVVFTVVLLLFGGAVMLGGGGLLFGIHWPHPFALATLTLGYAGFTAGLMALLAALVREERHANTLNHIVAMVLAMAGGCLFPKEQLPALMRDHLTPLLPTYWFTETVRNLAMGTAGVEWGFVSLRFVLVGALLIGVAVALFQRRFKSGLRA